MSNKPYGLSVFCDDIRMEVGGKPSYMGVYTGELIANVPAPLALPKLCVAVSLMIPLDMNFANVLIAVQQEADGTTNELARLEMDQIERPEMPPEGSEAKYFKFTPHLAISPFVIERESLLKVRAYIDGGEEIRLGSLPIKLASHEGDKKN